MAYLQTGAFKRTHLSKEQNVPTLLHRSLKTWICTRYILV